MGELLDKPDNPDLVLTTWITSNVVEKKDELEDSSLNSNDPTSHPMEASIDQKHTLMTSAFDHSIPLEAPEAIDDVCNSPPEDSDGRTRHRFITGICITLSLAVLSLGALDLGRLIEQDATIDSKFNITYSPKKEQVSLVSLPSNFSFLDPKTACEGLRAIETRASNGQINYGFADAQNNVVVLPTYAEIDAFHEGLAAVRSGTKDLWGYIDKSGKIVIPPRFKVASAFDDGLASVRLGTKGAGALIDKSGRVLITSMSEQIPERFGDLYQVYGSTNKCGLIDKTLKWILPCNYLAVQKFPTRDLFARLPSKSPPIGNDDQYFKIYQNDKCGIIDRSGNIVKAPSDYEISSFNKGHAAVLIDGKYGFVDNDNKMVIQPLYDYVTTYDDVIAVKQGEKWHLIDRTGKDLNVQVDGVIADPPKPWMSDGLGVIIKDNLCGFINSKGVVTIKPKYDFAFGFSDGYALVWSDGVWKYIDKNGDAASGKTFSEASVFYKNKADATVAGPLYKFVNARNIEEMKDYFKKKRADFIDLTEF